MSLGQDLRYGLRLVGRQPGYALLVGLTLAVAIAANTVIFSFANVLLLRPLPIEDQDSMAFVFSLDPNRDIFRGPLSYPDYVAFRDGLRAFDSLDASTRASVTMTGRGEPRRLAVNGVSGNIFQSWGVHAAAGRLLEPEDDRPGAPCTVALAHRFWQREFSGDGSALGAALMLDGRPCTIVGVVAPAMEYGSLSTLDVWMPIARDPSDVRRDERIYSVRGRLRPGVTLEQADAEVRVIAGRLARDYPATHAGWSARAASFKEGMTGRQTWLILGLLSTVVGFVLVVACANVANLMLARAVLRRRELAVRAALGASRGRVVAQLLTESLLLGLTGGALGLALAFGALRVIKAVAHEPFFALVSLDANVLAFVSVLSLLTPVLFGVLPAIHASSASPGEALKDGARSLGGMRARRSRNALVVTQIALALTLLVVAGLVVRTVIAFDSRPLGFDLRSLLTLRIELPDRRYAEADTVRRFFERIEDDLAFVPGVRSAGAVSRLPIVSGVTSDRFEIEGRPADRLESRPWAGRVIASAGYFRAIGIPVLRGRAFTQSDSTDSRRVALVSLEAARRYWKEAESAVGSRISFTRAEGPPEWLEIVGVVADTAGEEQQAPDPVIYVANAQSPARAMSLVLRGDPDPGRVRAAIASADPELAVFDMETMETTIAEWRSTGRIFLGLFIAFAAISLLLATSGLYGVISYTVGQRTQEIGVRVALGADPADIRRLVVGQGARLLAVGAALGVAGALALAHAVGSLLEGVTPRDPLTYGSVVAIVLTAALLASYVPARRAARLDPVNSLRQ
jgi:putative ABC transport system permease protein